MHTKTHINTHTHFKHCIHTHRHDLSSRENDEGEEKNVDEYVFFNAINLKKSLCKPDLHTDQRDCWFPVSFCPEKKSVNQSGAAHRLLKLFTIFVHF